MEAAMNPMNLTIGEIARDWYFPEKLRRRRTNTTDGYVSSARLYVIPKWEDMTIAEITRDAVQVSFRINAKQLAYVVDGKEIAVFQGE